MEAGQGPGPGPGGDTAEREVPKPYVPTEEERRLLKECAEESFRRKSEFSDVPSQSFTESSSPSAGFPPSSSYSDDYSSTDRALSSYEPVPFSASLNESSPTGISDYSVQEPAPVPEESRKKKGITYEELRNKHRQTYEVMQPPKAETPSKFSQEKPAKEVKVNKYGDTWDE